MLENIIVITGSSELYATIQSDLLEPTEGQPLCRTVLPQIKTTAAAMDAIGRPGRSIDLLVIEALTPSSGDAADGEQGEPTLQLLRHLREPQSPVRGLVLLPHRMEAIEAHCADSRSDYALYTKNFSSASARAALGKLGFDDGKVPARPSDVTIEIEIGGRLSKVKIIEDDREQNLEVLVPNINALPVYAESFRTWRMFETIEGPRGKKIRAVPGWREHLKLAGMPLYDNLVRSVLGEGLLQEYIRRPEGLLRVHFRFHIPDNLFTVPFEALYDASSDSFIRIRSPLARRFLIASGIHPSNDNRRAPLQGDLRILFVRAQVDGTAQLADEKGGSLAQDWYDFDPLANLDLEEAMFQKQIEGRPWHGGKVVVEYYRGKEGTTFAEGLRQEFERKFDYVHFAGHSLTTDSGQTFLILPTGQPSRLVGLPVSAFAQWAGVAGVRFVYLSSCRGGSCRAVQNLVANGVPHVLGFRWDVEDEMAARFAEIFYTTLLQRDQPIAKAYRDACEGLHNDPERGTSPIWATPLLIMQTDDWWRRSA